MMSDAQGFVPAAWKNLASDARPKVRYWLPAAAVEDDDLVAEVEALAARGFGGIEAVPLLGTPQEVVDGEDGWGTPRWDRVVRLLDATCSRLGMSLDLANGPMWPISMPTVGSADDPAALYELTWGAREFGEGEAVAGAVPLPSRRTVHDEGTPRLECVLAWQALGEKTLVEGSCVELTGAVEGEGDGATVRLDLGAPEPGCRWLLFAFWGQPSCQKTAYDHYYVIDHLSLAGAKACKRYWEPLFEGGAGLPAVESLFCDSLEYQVCMDWTRGFAEEFRRRRGYSILPYLPVVGLAETYPASDVPGYAFGDDVLARQVDNDYREVLTQLYCERHLAALERVAEGFGKTVRYQVAYNKPFEEERCGLYVGIPENEALGRPAMDGMKCMAAAAHLGRKPRYSFECAAEFGNCYGQSYEDLMWWVKRGLVAGMNAQVLHGAAYSGAYRGAYAQDGMMRGVEWPGYEAFGKWVSNLWNRTPSVEDARGCLDAIARLNALFRAPAKVDVAVFRQSYVNDGLGSEFCYFPDDGRLMNRGFSYETVSEALLKLPVCAVTRGELDRDGVGYRALVVPEQQLASTGLLRRVARLLDEGLPVVWVGEKPKAPLFRSECGSEQGRAAWEEALGDLWAREGLMHVARNEDVAQALLDHGVRPRLELEGERDIAGFSHVDEASHLRIYGVYAYNRVRYAPDDPNPDETVVSAIFRDAKSSWQRAGLASRGAAKVALEGVGRVYRLDYWTGASTPLDFRPEDGRMVGSLELEEDELAVLALREDEEPPASGDAHGDVGERWIDPQLSFDRLTLREFGPATEGERSYLRSGLVGEPIVVERPSALPWRELDGSLEHFAGEGVYEGSFSAPAPLPGQRLVLRFEHACDSFRVWVNGHAAPFPDQVLNEVEVTGLAHEGANDLRVRVTSNLYNKLMGTEKPYVPKGYGVWGEALLAVREG